MLRIIRITLQILNFEQKAAGQRKFTISIDFLLIFLSLWRVQPQKRLSGYDLGKIWNEVKWLVELDLCKDLTFFNVKLLSIYAVDTAKQRQEHRTSWILFWKQSTNFVALQTHLRFSQFCISISIPQKTSNCYRGFCSVYRNILGVFCTKFAAREDTEILIFWHKSLEFYTSKSVQQELLQAQLKVYLFISKQNNAEGSHFGDLFYGALQQLEEADRSCQKEQKGNLMMEVVEKIKIQRNLDESLRRWSLGAVWGAYQEHSRNYQILPKQVQYCDIIL